MVKLQDLGSSAVQQQRSAVVLFGRVGTMSTAAKRSGRGDPRVIDHAAPSIMQHVIQPWQRVGMSVDLFIHSWNPELGARIDEHYAPSGAMQWSNHSDAQFGVHGVPMTLPIHCDRVARDDAGCVGTQWALRGLASGLRARRAWAASHRHLAPHDRVLVMRHDVFFFDDMPIPPLNRMNETHKSLSPPHLPLSLAHPTMAPCAA